MLMLAGLLTWLVAGAPSPAVDKFAQPPVDFALVLNGQTTDLVPGQTRDVTAGGATFTAALAVKPTRLLRTPELSFRFPCEFELEHGDPDKWELSRGDDAIRLSRKLGLAGGAGGPDEVIQRMAGERKVRTSPVEIRLGGRTIPGRRARFEVEGGARDLEVFFVTAGKTGYELTLLRGMPAGQDVHPITVAARQLLVDTFALGAPVGTKEDAPYEFTVKLGDVSVDLTENETRAVTIAGAALTAQAVTKQTRTLRTPEVSLRYPKDYVFSGYTATEDGTDNWSMEGSHQMVALVRTRAKGDAAATVRSVIEVMTDSMGRPAIEPAETTFADAKRKGTRATFTWGTGRVVNDLFPFSAGEAGYVLIFTQSGAAGAAPTGEVGIRQSIEKSVKIAK